AGFLTMLFREWIGKWISGLIFGLGFLWILFDRDNQGWHAKIASTYVVAPAAAARAAPVAVEGPAEVTRRDASRRASARQSSTSRPRSRARSRSSSSSASASARGESWRNATRSVGAVSCPYSSAA